MNIHRHSVTAVSAAIPEGHLLHASSTFLLYLLPASTSSQCDDGMLVSWNADFTKNYILESACACGEYYAHAWIYSITCKKLQMYALKSVLEKTWTSFLFVRARWWLLHGPSALKHTHTHTHSEMFCCSTSNINVWVNQKKKSLDIQHDWMYKRHLLFSCFPQHSGEMLVSLPLVGQMVATCWDTQALR